jgi:hypothetical protein
VTDVISTALQEVDCTCETSPFLRGIVNPECAHHALVAALSATCHCHPCRILRSTGTNETTARQQPSWYFAQEISVELLETVRDLVRRDECELICTLVEDLRATPGWSQTQDKVIYQILSLLEDRMQTLAEGCTGRDPGQRRTQQPPARESRFP